MRSTINSFQGVHINGYAEFNGIEFLKLRSYSCDDLLILMPQIKLAYCGLL